MRHRAPAGAHRVAEVEGGEPDDKEADLRAAAARLTRACDAASRGRRSGRTAAGQVCCSTERRMPSPVVVKKKRSVGCIDELTSA